MKKYFFASLILVLSSCAVVTNSMQDGVVYAPQIEQPVRITDEKSANSVTIRPTFYVNRAEEIALNTGTHSKVNSQGIYEIEPVEGEKYFKVIEEANIFDYEGDNLRWQLPRLKTGIEFEIAQKFLALHAGVNYTQFGDRKKAFLGGDFGFSFFHYFKWLGWRADANLHFNHVRYEIDYLRTVKYYSGGTYVYLYGEENETTYRNFSYSITINTKEPGWPLNFFTGVHLGKQTFFDLLGDFHYGDDIDYSGDFTNLSFGLYRNLSPKCRIIAGLQWNSHPDHNGKATFLSYILQLDLMRLDTTF